MKNFKHIGDTVTFTAGAAISSGDYVVQGGLRGVAVADAANGEQVTLKLSGVFELPKTAAQTYAAGDLLYWDGSAVTSAVTGSVIGAAHDAAASADTVCDVRLNGIAV